MCAAGAWKWGNTHVSQHGTQAQGHLAFNQSEVKNGKETTRSIAETPVVLLCGKRYKDQKETIIMKSFSKGYSFFNYLKLTNISFSQNVTFKLHWSKDLDLDKFVHIFLSKQIK